MKCTLKIATVVLMLGTTVASAQTPTQTHPFVEQYREMQTLTTANPYVKAASATPSTWDTPPVFRDTADAPIGNEAFAECFAFMQQASANSPVPVFEAPPRPATVAADPVGNESFEERFHEMQAASSNSGQFGFHPGGNDLASEASSSSVVGLPLHNLTRR